jgi:hypothetical protein
MLAASDQHAAIHAPAGIEQAPPGEFVERSARLVTILLVARLVTPAGDALARVRNLSSGGLMMETSVALETGDAVRVELRNLRAIAGRIAWTKNGRAGIQFDEPADIADLLHPPAPQGRGARVPRAPRLSTCCPVQVQHQGRSCRAMLLDLSQKGGCLQTPGAMGVGDQLTVTVPGLPPQRGVVRWLRDDRMGVVFLDTVPFGELDRWLQDEAVRFAGRSDPA